MKPLILALLLMGSLSVKAQYHVRVECFGGVKSDPDYQYYIIRFTNDNWKTSSIIMDAFDISDTMEKLNVCHQPKLFTSLYTSKQDAISFAKELTSFKKCVAYNKSILDRYNRLVIYRRLHPIKPKFIPKSKRNCCKLTQIY